MKSELTPILAAFGCTPQITVRRLGKGNINETYLVDSSPHPFVLQRINDQVFPDPEVVINNFAQVYNHVSSTTAAVAGGFVMAGPVFTKSNTLSVVDKSGAHWRAQHYINTTTVQRIRQESQVSSVGSTLAKFHSLLKDLPLDQLTDPLPGFHQLPLYLANYDVHSGNTVTDVNNSVSFCHKAVERYRDQAGALEQVREKGDLPRQIVHGDPKLDNFIFDTDGCAVGLLDLDTVAGGVVYHDLGDCLRSVCSTGGESVKDRKIPGFDLTKCEWLLEGYMSDAGSRSRDLQPELIYSGLLAICFELAVRFFTDHLQGNIYFKVDQDTDNLIKAKKQFLLCEEISKKEQEICKTIQRIFAMK